MVGVDIMGHAMWMIVDSVMWSKNKWKIKGVFSY